LPLNYQRSTLASEVAHSDFFEQRCNSGLSHKQTIIDRLHRAKAAMGAVQLQHPTLETDSSNFVMVGDYQALNVHRLGVGEALAALALRTHDQIPHPYRLQTATARAIREYRCDARLAKPR
jgi:hypothetical protein